MSYLCCWVAPWLSSSLLRPAHPCTTPEHARYVVTHLLHHLGRLRDSAPIGSASPGGSGSGSPGSPGPPGPSPQPSAARRTPRASRRRSGRGRSDLSRSAYAFRIPIPGSSVEPLGLVRDYHTLAAPAACGSRALVLAPQAVGRLRGVLGPLGDSNVQDHPRAVLGLHGTAGPTP